MKKFLLALMLLCLYQIAFANSCPSIQDIKNNTLKGWQAFDSDEEKPLSAERFAIFQRNAEQFVLAEWINTKHQNSIHCYYHDINGSDLSTYLTRNDFIPEDDKKSWYKVTGAMHCAASNAQCSFRETVFSPKQLARK